MLEMNSFVFAWCAWFFISISWSQLIKNNQKDCCTDFANAVKCLAVNSCINEKWRQEIIQVNNDNACLVCLNETKIFKLNKDKTPTAEEAKVFLATINNLSSNKPFKLCYSETYDPSYLDQLLTLLKSNLDDTNICYLLNFCNNLIISEDVAETVINENSLSLLPIRDINEKVDECENGPFYWCLNISTAQSCQATDHCIETIWRLHHYADDDNAVCRVCKEIIMEARSESQRKNPRDLQEIFVVSCLIPFSEIRSECVSLPEKYDVNLEKIIQSELNPTKICSVAGFCNNARINELIALQPTKLEKYLVNQCTNCTTAFTLINRYLQKNSKTDIIQYLAHICDKFTNLDSCSAVVNFYFEKIYPTLLDMQPWEACHLTSMCAYKYHLHRSITFFNLQNEVNNILIQNDSTVICDLCRQLTSNIKIVLIANTGKQEFRQFAKVFCEQTAQTGESCSSSLDQNIDKFYDFLKAVNPTEFCKKFDFCSLK